MSWLLGAPYLNEAQAKSTFSRRTFLLSSAQVGVGVLLAGRMTYLSVFENERYALLAESNRVNLSLIPPRRGWILDRHGQPMAVNRTVFRVDVIPDRMTDKEGTLATLSALLNLTADERSRIKEDIDQADGFQPVQIAENLDWDRFAAVSIRAPELPGVEPAQGHSRFYPGGDAVGHLLGYVGAPSPKDYEETKNPLLIVPGFKIGKSGIEKALDDVLEGKPGARRTEVTARGKVVRDLDTRPDVPGHTVHLTVDAGLQEYAARRIGPHSAAVTVIDVASGDILAMASMPSYDPNAFSDGISKTEWTALSENDHLPLLNKTLQGLYPPGSVTKPMTSLAFLHAGVSPHDTAFCGGAYRVGRLVVHCSSRRGHGTVDMKKAIITSCDVYYYHFGLKVGITPMARMMRTMGLGQRFPLPASSQRYGTVPDPEWLLRKYGRDWSTYDTVNSSIGQGNVLVNPLQLAVMTARLASGRMTMPRLTGQGIPTAPSLGISAEHLAFVHEAMAGVVNSGYGTASVARLPVPGVQLAGKTGTAQVYSISKAERARGVRTGNQLPWRLRDHALFVGFAPADKPMYAISVIVEHGGWGATAAAPIARDVITWLFDKVRAEAALAAAATQWPPEYRPGAEGLVIGSASARSAEAPADTSPGVGSTAPSTPAPGTTTAGAARP